MRQQHIAEYGIAGVLLATPARASNSDQVGYLETSLAAAASAIASGYRAAPALMLGLIALVALPLAASGAGLVRWWRRGRIVPALLAAEAAVAEPKSPVHASLEVIGDQRAGRVEILKDMVRIGREEDNDIRIRSKHVQRYHAAIHREEFGIYRITALAGGDSTGVSVNGEPCEDSELKDGDIIQLGPGRLRFRSGLL